MEISRGYLEGQKVHLLDNTISILNLLGEKKVFFTIDNFESKRSWFKIKNIFGFLSAPASDYNYKWFVRIKRYETCFCFYTKVSFLNFTFLPKSAPNWGFCLVIDIIQNFPFSIILFPFFLSFFLCVFCLHISGSQPLEEKTFHCLWTSLQ